MVPQIREQWPNHGRNGSHDILKDKRKESNEDLEKSEGCWAITAHKWRLDRRWASEWKKRLNRKNERDTKELWLFSNEFQSLRTKIYIVLTPAIQDLTVAIGISRKSSRCRSRNCWWTKCDENVTLKSLGMSVFDWICCENFARWGQIDWKVIQNQISLIN
jgi:hypothetical protein